MVTVPFTLKASAVERPFSSQVLFRSGYGSRKLVLAKFDRGQASYQMSPFELMDRQMADMERLMDRQFEEMQREMNQAMQQTRKIQEELSRAEPGVHIQREEQRGPGSYHYYESITIVPGGGYTHSVHTSAAAPLMPMPVVLAAAVAVGAYLSATAKFIKNYSLTTYADSKKWLLAFAWPILCIASSRFRKQFLAAVQGKKPDLKDDHNL